MNHLSLCCLASFCFQFFLSTPGISQNSNSVSVPFRENFDSLVQLPENWHFHQNEGNVFTLAEGDFTNGSKILSVSSQHTYLFFSLPQLNAPVQNLRLRFMAKRNSGNAPMIIGVDVNEMGITTFFPVKTNRIYYSWQEHSVSFENYTGNGQYIVIRVGEIAGSSGEVYFDNFLVDYDSLLQEPLCVQLSNMLANSATVSLNGTGNATQWELSVVENGGSPEEGLITTTTEKNTTIYNLLPSTHYQVYVRSTSNGQTSRWTQPVEFETTCAKLPLPYSENFDKFSFNSFCGFFYTGSWDNASGYSLVNDDFVSSPNALQMEAAGSKAAIVLPIFDAPVNSLQLRFKARVKSGSNKLAIGVISSPYLVEYEYTTFDSVALTNQFAEYVVPLTNYYGRDEYITIYYPLTDAVGKIVLDDIAVERICECPRPFISGFDNLTDSTVTINLVELDEAENWEFALNPMDVSSGDSLFFSSTVPQFTFNGLTPANHYLAYARSVCSDESFSDWTEPFPVKTSCYDHIAPFTETFDNSDTIPDCWYAISQYYPNDVIVTNNYLQLFSVMGDAAVISPTIHQPLSGLQIRFDAESQYDSVLHVGTISDPYDATTFELIESIVISKSWEEYIVPLSLYSGNSRHVCFLINNYYFGLVRLDNITIEPMPTCPAPGNLSLSSIQAESVEVSWTEFGAAQSWEVSVCPENTIPDNGFIFNTTTNTASVDNLQPSTEYWLYCRALCSTTEHSSWSRPVIIRTECQDVETPYVINFGWEYGGFPECVKKVGKISFENGTGPSLTIEDMGGIILPRTDIPIIQTKLSFWVSSSYQSKQIAVGTFSNNQQLMSFTPFEFVNIFQNQFLEFDFSSYSGSDNYIGIVFYDYFGESRYSIGNITLDNAVPVKLPNSYEEIMMYPNPATNSITVSRKSHEKSLVEILDFTGRILFSIPWNEEEVTINIQNFAQGFYLVKYQTDKQTESHVIIKK